MECRASLIYAQLLVPGLDLDEVRYGQLLTVLAAVSALLVLQLLVVVQQAVA
jgi:hypothetical protein